MRYSSSYACLLLLFPKPRKKKEASDENLFLLFRNLTPYLKPKQVVVFFNPPVAKLPPFICFPGPNQGKWSETKPPK